MSELTHQVARGAQIAAEAAGAGDANNLVPRNKTHHGPIPVATAFDHFGTDHRETAKAPREVPFRTSHYRDTVCRPAKRDGTGT